MPTDLIDTLFRHPSPPTIDLPLPQRVLRPIVEMVASAIRLAFRAGLYQGFTLGALVTLALVVVWSQIKERGKR